MAEHGTTASICLRTRITPAVAPFCLETSSAQCPWKPATAIPILQACCCQAALPAIITSLFMPITETRFLRHRGRRKTSPEAAVVVGGEARAPAQLPGEQAAGERHPGEDADLPGRDRREELLRRLETHHVE